MSEISEQVSYPSVSLLDPCSSSEWLVVIAFLTCLCVCLARLSTCHITLNISLVLWHGDVPEEQGLAVAFILSSPFVRSLLWFISPLYSYHSFFYLYDSSPASLYVHHAHLYSSQISKFSFFGCSAVPAFSRTTLIYQLQLHEIPTYQ